MAEKRVNDLTPTSTLSGGVSFLVDGNVTNKIEYQDLLDSLRAVFFNRGDLKFYNFVSNENSADYIEMGEIEVPATTFNVFFVSSSWRNGKPMGIKMASNSMTFTQVENDSGYLEFCYILPMGGANSLIKFYEKIQPSSSGTLEMRLYCLWFSLPIQ